MSSVSTGHTSRVDDLKDYDDQKEPMCPLWKDLLIRYSLIPARGSPIIGFSPALELHELADLKYFSQSLTLVNKTNITSCLYSIY